MLEFLPQHGKVMLGPDRMIIMRQQAMSVLRGLLYEQLGDSLARAVLSQFGHQCGTGDYETLLRTYEWEDDLDTLTSGPVLHGWEGIVHAVPAQIDVSRERGHFYMRGEWHNSYEAEIHLARFGPSTESVCHSLTGYASGWSSAYFGKPCLCIEPTCVGKGDDVCRFEIRETIRWGAEAEPWKQALHSTGTSLVRELEELARRQRQAITELSTPIMEVWDDVLVVPIIGMVDTERSIDIMERVLASIAMQGARCLIIDITGVDTVDTRTADYLIKIVEAAKLLGAFCVVTGIGPGVAQTLVALGVDLSQVATLRNLKQGLRACLRHLAEG